MTFWMRSGWNLVLGYDPATGKLFQVKNEPAPTPPQAGGRGGGRGGRGGGAPPTTQQIEEQRARYEQQLARFNASKLNPDPGTYNLPTIQGGAETAIEMTALLNDPTWSKMWSQYCRLGHADAETLQRDRQTGNEGADASLVGEAGGGLGIGGRRLAAYAYFVTKNPAFAQRAIEGMGRPPVRPQRIEGNESLNPLDEAQGVSTNDMAQSSLNDIAVLSMCADQLPTEAPPPEQFGRGRGGRGGRGARGGGAPQQEQEQQAPAEQQPGQ
jgi:hypothetical protein